MADIFGSTEENNYIDVTKRDSAAETMEMVIAGTGGYSAPADDNHLYNQLYQKYISNNRLIKKYNEEYKKVSNTYNEVSKIFNDYATQTNVNKSEFEEILTKYGNQIPKLIEERDKIESELKRLKNENESIENDNNNFIKDEIDPINLISSQSEHRIHDGQKRFKTLGKTTSSKYPRPKTLFKVFFNGNFGVSIEQCNELSKFVMSVTKPDVQYTTKEMNQYNRKKYIIEGVKYGQLKITFIDVKDNPIQHAFFRYLMANNNDFKYSINDEKKYREYKENNETHFDDVDWGLNINSSEHMFNSITICEMFLDRLMVYKIENPTLKSINFGENKMGDYGYNEITVAFDVEGITNILDIAKSKNGNYNEEYVIGKQIADIGGKELANLLGMRWYQGNGASDKEDNDNDFISVLNSYKNAEIREYSIQKTKDLLSKVNENIELEDYINEIDKSFKMGNNASQYNWFAEAGYFSDNQQQVLQAGYSSKDYGYTGPRKTYYELSRNNEELAELGRANDSEYSSGNALDALLGVVKNPQDVSKMFSPRIKQLTDYFKF